MNHSEKYDEPLAYIGLVCLLSESNGIDVFSAKANGRSYASTKGRATFLKKQLIMLRQSKDRLIYLYKESEAKLYQVLVPCSSAGYLSAPNVSVAWPIWNICFTRRSLAYIKPLILTKLVSLHKTINTNKPVVEVIK